MNTHSQRFHNKIYPIKQKIPVYREIVGLKFIKNQNMLMTLCRQKVKKHGKMSVFSTTIIENENENPSLQNTIDVNLLFCSFNSVFRPFESVGFGSSETPLSEGFHHIHDRHQMTAFYVHIRKTT